MNDLWADTAELLILDLRKRALDRARQVAGPDEYRLSDVWLRDPKVIAVPEDNDIHAGVHNAEKLAHACAVYPSARWFAASVFAGEPSELLEVTDPGRALFWREDGERPLGEVYAGQSFLLYSLEDPAAILYSEHEFALVTGSAAFVGAYFGNVEEACRAFEV